MLGSEFEVCTVVGVVHGFEQVEDEILPVTWIQIEMPHNGEIKKVRAEYINKVILNI
jgi:hypothetical protein